MILPLLLALAMPIVIDGGDLKEVPPPPAVTLCVDSHGGIAPCNIPTQVLCWSAKQHKLTGCAIVAAEEAPSKGTLLRIGLLAGGNAWDVLTTGIALNNPGTVEANPYLQSAEIRWGAKGLGLVGEVAVCEVIARVFHRPKLATFAAAVNTAVLFAVGLHNLQQGTPAAASRRQIHFTFVLER